MKRIAITGSIGMGKSTIASMMRARGIPVFDADATVRALQGDGGALVAPIEAAFPGTTAKGRVDRDKLSAVLGDPEQLRRLEAIVHPAVQAERERFIEANGQAPALGFDIPLLFETGGESAFDAVIVVSAPEDIQRQRVLARPGMSAQKLDRILARQMPDAQKRGRADHVVDTGGTIADSAAQVDAILACLGLGNAQ